MKSHVYSIEQAFTDLGGKPDFDEVSRLIENYPTYLNPHRGGLLRDMLAGKTLKEMGYNKLVNKGEESNITKQKTAQSVNWAIQKLNKTIIRLWYLRYRIGKDMTRRQANREVLLRFPPKIKRERDSACSVIRKKTIGALIDS